MHAYMHAYIHTYIHTYTHTHIHGRLVFECPHCLAAEAALDVRREREQVYIHICRYAYIAYVYLHIHNVAYVYLHMCIYMFMYIRRVCVWNCMRQSVARYEEEDTCMSYEEEDTCVSLLRVRAASLSLCYVCLCIYTSLCVCASVCVCLWGRGVGG